MRTKLFCSAIFFFMTSSCSHNSTGETAKLSEEIKVERAVSSTLFPGEEDALKVHEALMDIFFPYELVKEKQSLSTEDDEKQKLDEIMKIANELKISLYPKVRVMSEMRAIHTLFANLDYLTSPITAALYYEFVTREKEEGKKKLWKETKNCRNFVGTIKKKKRKNILAFYDLNLKEREHLLYLMSESGLNYLRRISFSTRLLYNSKIYKGKLAALISGIEVEPPREDKDFFNPDLVFGAHQLNYNPGKSVIEGELDYIVVGSGVASSVVVNHLHRAGKRVMVIEKGSFIYPGAVNARDNFDFLDQHGLRSDNDGSLFLLNGSVVGGGSTVNIDMSYPPTLPYIKFNFEKWREQGLIPADLWTQEELANAHSWIEGIFKIRTIVDNEVNANNQILLRGAQAMGMKLLDDQHDLQGGIQRYHLLTNAEDEENLIDGRSIKITDKKSVVERLLWDPLENKVSLDKLAETTFPIVLESDATVARVLHKREGKNRRAIGVEFIKGSPWTSRGIINDPSGMKIPTGKKVKVYAKNIILSAGNLGSSVILLNSKIKNRNIGRGFSAHPFLPIVGFFNEEINAHLGTPSTFYIDNYLTKEKEHPRPGFLIESAAGNADLGGVLVPGTAPQVYTTVENLKHVGGLGVILVEEMNPENRVEVKNGKPVIYHNLSEIDRRRFAKGVAEGIRILFNAGAKKVSFTSFENVFKQRKEDSEFKFFNNIEDASYVETNMRFTENQSLIMGAHMLGGNKLGTSQKNSVVNPDYQVWGVNNLYVVDASVFPTSPGANPMESIYSIAKIFADRHLALNKSKKKISSEANNE